MSERRVPPRQSATDPITKRNDYQIPIFTMENMIAGILGSAGDEILMRPQP